MRHRPIKVQNICEPKFKETTKMLSFKHTYFRVSWRGVCLVKKGKSVNSYTLSNRSKLSSTISTQSYPFFVFFWLHGLTFSPNRVAFATFGGIDYRLELKIVSRSVIHALIKSLHLCYCLWFEQANCWKWTLWVKHKYS